jgi:hypothetical protein
MKRGWMGYRMRRRSKGNQRRAQLATMLPHMSQAEAARRLGISEATISRDVRHRMGAPASMEEIMAVFGVVFGQTDPHSSPVAPRNPLRRAADS